MSFVETVAEDFEGASGAITNMTPQAGEADWQRDGSGNAVGAVGYNTAVVHDTEAGDDRMAVEGDLPATLSNRFLIHSDSPPANYDEAGLFVGPELYYNGAFQGGYWGGGTADETCRIEDDGSGGYDIIVDGVTRASGLTPTQTPGAGQNYGGIRGTSTDPFPSLLIEEWSTGGGSPQTWTGSAAAIDATATSGAFAGDGTATWSGSTAAVSAAAVSGEFTAGTQTWTGTPANVAASATPGAFSGAGTAPWAGNTATVDAAAVSGAFTPASAAPWPGTSASIAATPVAGGFAGTGTASWVGSSAGVDVTAASGAFSGGSIWVGTAAQVAASATSSTFTPTGTASWPGSAGTVAATATVGIFTAAGAAAWAGSLATIDVAAVSGVFGDSSRSNITGTSTIDQVPVGTSALVAVPAGVSVLDEIPEGTSSWQT